MKMTYFNKPDHNYYRVMFEFTDKEMKAVGFEKLSFDPCRCEILRVLNRMADEGKNQREKPVPHIIENMPLIQIGLYRDRTAKIKTPLG